MLRKLQHGDVREDGKIFWGYNKKSKNGEDWRSPEVFARCKKRITVDNKQIRIKRQAFLDIAKSAHGCCECGERHPASLCFHHHKTNKLFNIGSATHYKWATIVEELKKCFVLCHNCHAKHHYHWKGSKLFFAGQNDEQLSR